MLANTIRSDAWWIMQCYELLVEPLTVPENIQCAMQRFRSILLEKMHEHVVLAENMENLLNETRAKPVISLQVFEKPVETPVTAPTPVANTSNNYIDILEKSQTKQPTLDELINEARENGMLVEIQDDTSDGEESVIHSTNAEEVASDEEVAEEEEEEVASDKEEEVVEDEASEDEEVVEDEASEDEEVAEEEEENWIPKRFKKRTYWFETNSRRIHEWVSDSEIGDQVGVLKVENDVESMELI